MQDFLAGNFVQNRQHNQKPNNDSGNHRRALVVQRRKRHQLRHVEIKQKSDFAAIRALRTRSMISMSAHW
jgi:hypothetical protein